MIFRACHVEYRVVLADVIFKVTLTEPRNPLVVVRGLVSDPWCSSLPPPLHIVATHITSSFDIVAFVFPGSCKPLRVPVLDRTMHCCSDVGDRLIYESARTEEAAAVADCGALIVTSTMTVMIKSITHCKIIFGAN